MFLVGVVFYFLNPLLIPHLEEQFKNVDLFRDWHGWTWKYMVIHPFVYALVFSAVFLWLRKANAFPPGVYGGAVFGWGVFCVGSLPVFLLEFASFQVSTLIIISWIVQNLCQYLAAGMVLGAIAERFRAVPSTRY